LKFVVLQHRNFHKNDLLSFTRECRHHSSEVQNAYSTLWQITHDTTHQISSELSKFCRTYYKNILAYFFGHSVHGVPKLASPLDFSGIT